VVVVVVVVGSMGMMRWYTAVDGHLCLCLFKREGGGRMCFDQQKGI
jgi:hypothetical protein